MKKLLATSAHHPASPALKVLTHGLELCPHARLGLLITSRSSPRADQILCRQPCVNLMIIIFSLGCSLPDRSNQLLVCRPIPRRPRRRRRTRATPRMARKPESGRTGDPKSFGTKPNCSMEFTSSGANGQATSIIRRVPGSVSSFPKEAPRT